MTGPEIHTSGAAPEGVRAGRARVEGPAGGAVHEMDVDHRSSSPIGPLVMAVAMLGLGILMLDQTLGIRGEGFSPGGPRFLPLVVVSIWTALSLVYLGQQVVRLLRGLGTLPAERFTHLGAAAALVALLVAYAYALEPLGYLIATVVFFAGTARTLGSRRLTRDVVVAVGLSVFVYVLFTRALGLHLPQGVLPL